MRFGAPRSPSPVKRRRRLARPLRPSTFGVPESSSEDDLEVSDTESSVSSSSGDSFVYDSDAQVMKPHPRIRGKSRNLAEESEMEAMVASIKLRVTHEDVYEEWENQTRKDAFISARHEQAELKAKQKAGQAALQSQASNARDALHQRQSDEVQRQLAQFRLLQQKQENDLRNAWKERDKMLRERIENVIKFEEQKNIAKAEAQRRQLEEEERLRKDAEEQQKQEQEKQKQETIRKQQEDEERQKQKEREDAEKRLQSEVDKKKVEQQQFEEKERNNLGMTTPAQDWEKGRDILKKLKVKPMPAVKGDKAMKSVWSAGRRAINPKIGQLTNDARAISRITQQIVEIINPTPALPKPIYYALLSSLAKTILLQAETEVTAEKRSAIPLAQVTANLLAALDRFPDVFWAKLCQRAGGWPVPYVIPANDIDGTAFDEATRVKVLGYRAKEALSEYTTRVAGLMRVYFHILNAPVGQPLDPRFRTYRYWSYFARMLSEPQLLDSPASAEVLYVALDVNGMNAKLTWGAQWIKLLEVLYEGVTTGLFGKPGKLIGGDTAEGVAARVRVQLEIERIMTTA